jgi:hypothetical protein
MPRLTKKLMFALGLAVTAAGAIEPAAAGPWAEVGDKRLRQDVELLRAAGLIRGPTNSWPLPWAQIARALETANTAELPPHVAQAVRRVSALSDRAERGSAYEIRAAATNEASIVRDFGATAREDGDVAVRAEHQFGRLYLSYGVGWRDGQRGNDVHFEPSYAALAVGNWALYGGYVEHWWGPGHQGAMMFSNSSRPFPKIGIKRLEPHAIDFPVLEWLGPWRLDAFVGILDENREFDNPAVAGFRVAFEPAAGLEIGLNRALQLCGRDRPCSFSTWTDSLIGLGDRDNTGTFDEPGNQLAGFDISYSRMIGTVSAQAYVEASAEDEDNFLIDKFAWLAGFNLIGQAGSNGASWEFNFEWTDTLANKFLGGTQYPNITYQNFIYSDGFTYRRRPIGHWMDGDSRVFSVGGAYTDTANRRWYASLHSVEFNRLGLARNRISPTPEDVNIARAGVEWPMRIGDVRLEGRVMDDEPNSPGRSPTRAQVELGWRSTF